MSKINVTIRDYDEVQHHIIVSFSSADFPLSEEKSYTYDLRNFKGQTLDEIMDL